MSRGTQQLARSPNPFAYGTITLFGRPFQIRSAKVRVSYSLLSLGLKQAVLQPPSDIGPQSTNSDRFELFPVRSPLLGESLLIYFPQGT